MKYSKFGREQELWKTDRQAFCERGGILPNSRQGTAIYALSPSECEHLTRLCDPAEDNLIPVDEHGCSDNHGNVGTRGINYDWF